MINRIVLFGTGNLGKRYVQAISGIGDIELFLFDISQTALKSIPDFLEQNNIKLNYHLTYSFDDIFKTINERTIVIVSTTLTGRMELLRNILKHHPKALICEKPVVQNNTDYLKLLELLKPANVPTFVDFTLRMQPFYQRIKEEIGNADSGSLFVNLPKTGLICVGIHNIDLFLWLFNLTGCDIITTTFSAVYEQKRAGFYDVTGSLVLEKSSFKAFIGNSSEEDLRTAQIITKEFVYNVHEDQRIMIKVNKQNGKLVISENIEYSFVSKYMTELIRNIISGNFNKINLPGIEDSYQQHKIIFDYLKKHSIEDLNFT
jgi:predicted dehydrogenase